METSSVPTVHTAQSNTRPLLIFTTYLATNTFLTLLLSRSITVAYNHNKSSLAATRNLRSRISSHFLLTILSLGVTWYFMLSFFILSYRSWAVSHHIPLPGYLHATDLLRPDVIQTWLRQVKLGSWLKDVQLFREAWETVVETEARTFWSMPIFGVTTLWSFFIAKEAQVRRIGHGWAYMVLGQLVAISFAMNLFYLAVLVHPEPDNAARDGAVRVSDIQDSEEKMTTKVKHTTPVEFWLPSRSFCLTLRTLTAMSAIIVVTEAGNRYFLWWLAIPHILLFLPPILHATVPRSWRANRLSKATYDAFYANQFNQIFIAFALVEGVVLSYALRSDPRRARHRHRHSNVHLYPWHNEAGIMGETVVQSLWRSLMDHPAVSSVGWDSILCTISYIAWRRFAP